MIKTLNILLLALIFVACSSTPKQKEKAPLEGLFTWDEWLEKSEWVISPPPDFDKNMLKSLEDFNSKDKYKYIIFATSNCESCVEYLPDLFYLFQEIGIEKFDYELIGIDELSKNQNPLFIKMNLPNTPALILMKDGKHIHTIQGPYYDWLEDILEAMENSK